jgi:hypothetical protein
VCERLCVWECVRVFVSERVCEKVCVGECERKSVCESVYV